jgi:siroheme synthase-like protein
MATERTRRDKHPILLDLDGHRVVVLGAGAVAERKIEALLETGAEITVVAPEQTPRIRQWAADGQLRLERRRYESGDLRGARLAYAAMGDVAANRLARQEADEAGIWLNVADVPDLCDFFAPGVVRRGALTVAISTDGASPALAARLRERFEREIGPEYAEVLEQLRELRARSRAEGRPLADVREEIEQVIDRVLPRSVSE